jgi:preprotein translocase subunit SecD
VKYLRQILLIVVVLGIAIYLVTPTPVIPGLDREIKTYLGLDLVGGIQVLLEADLPEDADITPEQMGTARRIVENRVNGLGVSEAVVQQAGNRRIVVELPGVEDPEQAVATIRGTALLEFVDLDFNPVSAGTYIQTDYPKATAPIPPEDATVIEDQVFHTIMTGADLRQVTVTADQVGRPGISFELTAQGTQIFAEHTTNNVKEYLAIVLDNQVISAPVIDEPITTGSGIISGNFTLEEANALAVQLRYGSLPIPLRVVETRTIGPTLGEDSLNKSLVAGMIGLSIVMLFMLLYYRLPGLVADLAIIIYALITFALFRTIPVTLTLAGIAGLMLSTGSALDANILIFERLKEELRQKRTLQQAVDLGFRRAWPSIRDSNIATLITCSILFWFGSAFGATIVKGFAVTLFIGVIVSLFSAIFVTRVALNLLFSNYEPRNLPRWFGL